MEEQELKARIGILIAFYAAMARPVSDRQIAAVANATARVPLQWLRSSCEYITQTWSMNRNPGGAEIQTEAARRAGFRARHNAWVGYTDPRPIWWPRFPETVPPQLAERWADHPARLGIPAGHVVVVSGPRQLTAGSESRESDRDDSAPMSANGGVRR
jgi:hypothetical protein